VNRVQGSHHPHAVQSSTAELAGFLAGLGALPRGALDLGCGSGSDAVYLAERGIETIGVDLSSAALERARERATSSGVHVDWIQADVLRLPLADGSVDLALDRGCLHHVAAADHSRYAAEVARVLRPGGTLLVCEMNEAGRHDHAITEAALRDMTRGTPLSVRSIVTYDIASVGHSRAMLAAIDRG
jgi:ubiquinone/menaquinone biosynthesis C-methylase UbiE